MLRLIFQMMAFSSYAAYNCNHVFYQITLDNTLTAILRKTALLYKKTVKTHQGKLDDEDWIHSSLSVRVLVLALSKLSCVDHDAAEQLASTHHMH